MSDAPRETPQSGRPYNAPTGSATSPFGAEPVAAELVVAELAAVPSAALTRGARWVAAIERWRERQSEWLNPILVKESRQALKSKQFSITFGLVLLFAWGWTFLGLARMGPSAAYAPAGPVLFVGYVAILAFALLVLVPFGAFRSLASEQEERTYELLSITTLRPGQIIRGKLGSAAVQMLIHLSAVSPCLAFTYLLRGIDFPTILYTTVLLAGASMGLSVVGLAVASLTENKYLQVLLSVLFLGGVFVAFIGAFVLIVEMEDGGFRSLPVTEVEFWIANAVLATFYFTTFAMVYSAAAARISFVGSNRSTRLRACMVVQTLALVFWVTWGLTEIVDPEFLEAMFTLALCFWFAMGALMTGESPELSLRVRRSLPQSLMGRAFLTWFNPGPATGYALAVCAVLTCALLVTIAAILHPLLPNLYAGGRRPNANWERAIGYALLGASYLTIYLGVGMLALRALRRFGRISPPVAALVQGALIGFGSAAPAIIQAITPSLYARDYTLLQVTNVAWTLYLAEERGFLHPLLPTLLWLLPAAAFCIFAVNVPAIIRELRYVRVARPARVEEEDLQLSPPPPKPAESPWDP